MNSNDLDETGTAETLAVAPVLVSADEELIHDVLRLSAAAGVAPDLARDVGTALRSWVSAPVMLVGTDLLPELAACRPERRSRVQVVGPAPIGDLVFRDALAVGAETVAELPASSDWLVETLTDCGDGPAAPGRTIGVLGGAGGVGATVFAAALARAAARQGPSLVVDLDPIGAGMEQVLGMEDVPGVRWDALLSATGRLSARSLRDALPARDGLSVLGWPQHRSGGLQAFATREVLSAARRGFDHAVLDLPRHGDAVVDEVLTRCDDLVLVTTATVPAVTAASRVAAQLPPGGHAHVVVRTGRGSVPAAEVAEVLSLPLLCTMGPQRGLDEAIDLGAGPARSVRGALGRAAAHCLAGLAGRERVAA